MDALSGSRGPGPREPRPDETPRTAPDPGDREEFPGGDREIRAAIALSEARGLAAERLRRVLDRVGSSAAVVGEGAGRAAWRAHLRPGERSALAELEPAPPERLERLRNRGVRVVPYRGPGYPRRLLHLHQPPPALYLKGPGRLATPSVAVVGTRSATSYGRRAARDLAGGLARSGWTVVSGLARGIDAAAHRAALDAGGTTTGVLGAGLEHRYPASSRDLYDRLEERGLLVTEFPPGQPPQRWTFPKRNRIIAALSAGVVVVQAPGKSGALITADQALELGREVFAVPGPVGVPASRGTHELLRSGAPLAARADDVLELLAGPGLPGGRAESPAGTGGDGSDAGGQRELALQVPSSVDEEGAGAVWAALRDGAETLEELEARAGLPPGRLLALLAELELAGRVRGLPGDRYEPVQAEQR